MKYIFGGYGCLNVGDEAIWAGANTKYPGSMQVYVNKPTAHKAVWYADLLLGKVKFDSLANGLIIGGGGILHARSAILSNIAMAKLAIANELDVTLEGVGFTELNPNYIQETKELLSLASSVTVRDSTSLRIAKDLGCATAILGRDFAYDMPVSIPKPVRRSRIGVIPSPHSDIEHLTEVVKKFLQEDDVCLIPHSRSYTGESANDVITCEKLWSKWDLHNQPNVLSVWSYCNDPYSNIYALASLTKVYSERLHGCIFAHIANTPLLVPATTRKLRAFLKDQSNNPTVQEYL